MEVIEVVLYQVFNNIYTYRHFTILKDELQRTYICKYNHDFQILPFLNECEHIKKVKCMYDHRFS